MADLKKSIEKIARYYGSAFRKSDQRAGMYPKMAQRRMLARVRSQ